MKVFDQLADEVPGVPLEVPGVPLDRHLPDHVCHVAEERDDEVRSCEVPDKQVDRGRTELSAGIGRSVSTLVAQPTATPATSNANNDSAVGGQRYDLHIERLEFF